MLRRLRRALKPPHRVLDATKLAAAIDRGDPEATTRDARSTPRSSPAATERWDTSPTRFVACERRRRSPSRLWARKRSRARARMERRRVGRRAVIRRAQIGVDASAADAGGVDRWKLDARRRGRAETTTRVFTNYLGIGVDARAALAFDTVRKDARFSWLAHADEQTLYAVFGARDFLQHSFARLDEDVVVVDDRVVEFPSDTEGIILLNINSSAAACACGSSGSSSLRGDATFIKSREDDGALEIVAVTGALHLGQLNARVAKPVQVAQGRRVRVELKRDLPVQIDGEPGCNSGDARRLVSRFARRASETAAGQAE